jgi:uncharacterized membrane protein
MGKSVAGFVLALIGSIIGIILWGAYLFFTAALSVFLGPFAALFGGGASLFILNVVPILGLSLSVLSLICSFFLLKSEGNFIPSFILVGAGVFSLNLFVFIGGLLGWFASKEGSEVNKATVGLFTPNQQQTTQASSDNFQSNQGVVTSSDSKTYAIIGVFLGIIGWLIVKSKMPNDDYAMFYAKHGLALSLIAFANYILGWVLPGFIGMITWVISLGVFVLWIMCLLNATSLTKKEVPIVSMLAEKF